MSKIGRPKGSRNRSGRTTLPTCWMCGEEGAIVRLESGYCRYHGLIDEVVTVAEVEAFRRRMRALERGEATYPAPTGYVTKFT